MPTILLGYALGGRTYSYEEVTSWLEAAGFAKARRKNLLRAPGNALILATKGGS